MTWAPECTVIWDGLAASVLLLAIPLAAVITALTIALYRRSIGKAMRLSAGLTVSAYTPSSQLPAVSAPLRILRAHPDTTPMTPTLVHSQATMRAVSAVYALAGIAQSLIVTILYLWQAGIELRPMRTFMVWLPFAWPIILTLSLTATATRRQKYTLLGGYFRVLLTMDGAADLFGLRYQPGFGELVLLWGLNAGLPTIVMVLLGNRAWRSVGFIALFYSIVAVTGGLLGFQGLGCLTLSTQSETLLSSIEYLLAVVILLTLTGGWWGFRRLVQQYQAKRYSDQMLIVDSLWLLVTLIEGLGQMGTAGIGSLAYASAFMAYKAVSIIGLRRLRSADNTEHPHTLLMLRVFGFTTRTRRLTDEIGHYWRYGGPINMIGGTDLAASLIEPDELFQFWSRKLRQAFIANESDLQTRLSTLDMGRDPDRRYRINEFFCHDNTWQATVKALAARSAVVLMDLRGFGKENRGCKFELEMLFEVVPVSRIVLLVDQTTKIEPLMDVLHAAWTQLSSHSPNKKLTNPELTLFEVTNSSHALQPLLSRMFMVSA